jgi:signal transduction histidine kinase
LASIRNWTLRGKVVLHIIVLGVASALALAVLYMTTQRRLLLTLADQKAELVSTLVMDSIFTLKKCGRVEETEAKIHSLLLEAGSLRRIRILTTEGRVYVSTDSAEKGGLLPPEEFGRARELLVRHAPRQIFHVKEDASIEALMLVENRPECFACHDQTRPYNGLLDVHIDTGETTAVLRSSRWKGVAVAVGALAVLTIIVLRLFERLINRPIRRLQQEMTKVQDGDLTVRLAAAKKDEIGRLTESFNLMVENLREANRKIAALYDERMERAEHLASFGELAAGLAHEVRNPLAGIKGALEIIHRTTPEADPRKDIFDEVLRQTDKTIAVIQDFLNYARPKPFFLRPVSPNLFVENAVRLAETQVGGKRVRLEVHYLPEEVRVCLDADRMQDVVLNLLLNALAAIGDEGRVEVVLGRTDDGTFELRVGDNGAGIKPEVLSQIFTPFFSTKKGGTGLGLSICRKAVEAHGGTISVESEAGRGTAFTIRIPPRGPEGQPCP